MIFSSGGALAARAGPYEGWAGNARKETEGPPISNQTHYYKPFRQGNSWEVSTQLECRHTTTQDRTGQKKAGANAPAQYDSHTSV